MKKYITGLLMSFSLILAGNLYASDSLNTRNQQTGILWEVSKSTSRPSYLLGTVHSDDTRVIKLPKIILDKLNRADSFTAELKMDRHSMQQASQLMFLSPGQTLESQIGAKRYQSCIKLLSQYGLTEAMINKMKPWAVVVTLSMPRSRTGLVLDHYLYKEAEQLGKRTYGLETNREQIAVFESFALREQIIMLDEAIKDFNRLPAIFDELVHLYLQRDLTGLERISDKYMLQGNSPLAKSFRKRALIDRNYLMLRRMKPRLLEGNSFIAVGALHLPGDEGILRLLQQEGYTVRPVY
ncbi:MAG: TraB/GumN family protein [Gammaproteobacteria bacterium]|nr:TraB/GumN family protein [Gammaproteobacteria bacterium]